MKRLIALVATAIMATSVAFSQSAPVSAVSRALFDVLTSSINNAQLPKEMDGLTLESVELTDEAIWYNFYLPDSSVLEGLKEEYDERKAAVIAALSKKNPDTALLSSLCVFSHRSLIYLYTTDDDYVVVKIPSSQLAEIWGYETFDTAFWETAISTHLSYTEVNYKLGNSSLSLEVPIPLVFSQYTEEELGLSEEIIEGAMEETNAFVLFPLMAMLMERDLSIDFVDQESQYRNIYCSKSLLEQYWNESGMAASYNGIEEERISVMPTFQGEEPRHIYDWIEENLVYPKKAYKKGVEGSVSVDFVIDTEGNVTNVTVTESAGKLFDKEALRLMNSCPKWTPAYDYNGNPKPKDYSITIDFVIEK